MQPTYIVTKAERDWAVVSISHLGRQAIACFARFGDAYRFVRTLRRLDAGPASATLH